METVGARVVNFIAVRRVVNRAIKLNHIAEGSGAAVDTIEVNDILCYRGRVLDTPDAFEDCTSPFVAVLLKQPVLFSHCVFLDVSDQAKSGPGRSTPFHDGRNGLLNGAVGGWWSWG